MMVELLTGVSYLASPYSFSSFMQDYNRLLAEEKIVPYYIVEVQETLSKKVPVRADNPEQALEDVKKLYKQCEVVLEAEDFVDCHFNILPTSQEDAKKHFYLKE